MGRLCKSVCGVSAFILRFFLVAKGDSAFSDDGVQEGVAKGGDESEQLWKHLQPSGIFSTIALRAMSMWSGTDWRIGWSGASNSRIRLCWFCASENCSWRDCDN